MAFYAYRQNNSGGSFDYDRNAGISVFVVVEAEAPNVARERAVNIGLYFDGVDNGYDCSCCGDRWYEPWNNDGMEQPGVYEAGDIGFDKNRGVYVYAPEHSWAHPWMSEFEGFVHFADGAIVPVEQRDNRQLEA